MSAKASTPFNEWTIEDTATFELAGPFDMDFEVSLAFPPNYQTGSAAYPLLLVLDAPTAFPVAVSAARAQGALGAADEVIVAGVSTPRREGRGMLGLNRLKYLTPGPPNREGDNIAVLMKLLGPLMQDRGLEFDDCFGGAEGFLDFLETSLVPEISRRTRLRPSGHCLFGHSAAGAFAVYALLEQSPAFDNYIVGTFGTEWWTDFEHHLDKFRSARRAGSDQPSLNVFHGVGGQELTDPAFRTAVLGLPYMEALGAEKLDGLHISTQVFPDENHASVIPHIISTGIRQIYGTGADFAAGLEARIRRDGGAGG
jgi:predicted alpha/beta superfamily hydrolase